MRSGPDRPGVSQALLAPPCASLVLLVVSTRPGLGPSIQHRLDQIAPAVYRVRQVETLAALENALRVGVGPLQAPAASFIDLACPTWSRGYAPALAHLPRPIALLDAAGSQPSAVRDLVRRGFLAALPATIDGWTLHGVLAWHLQKPEIPVTQANPMTEARVLCAMCDAAWPDFARFCGDCGAQLFKKRGQCDAL